MRRSVRTLLIVASAVLVVAAVVVLVVVFQRSPAATPATSPTSTRTSTPITAPTPTQTASPSAVPTPASTDSTQPGPAPTDEVQPEPTPAGPATVTIVSWGADGATIYASGIVTGDAGEGGTCSLTATSSTGQMLTATRDAQATPAAVNCGVIQIAAPPGDWMLVLAYRSQLSSAASGPTLVTQP